MGGDALRGELVAVVAMHWFWFSVAGAREVERKDAEEADERFEYRFYP